MWILHLKNYLFLARLGRRPTDWRSPAATWAGTAAIAPKTVYGISPSGRRLPVGFSTIIITARDANDSLPQRHACKGTMKLDPAHPTVSREGSDVVDDIACFFQ